MQHITKLPEQLTNRKPIYIDRAMMKSTELYLKLGKENINNFEVALANKDFCAITSLANQVYRHGDSFNFPYIRNAGKRIEDVAKLQNPYLLQCLIALLKTYLTNVQVYYF